MTQNQQRNSGTVTVLSNNCKWLKKKERWRQSEREIESEFN